MKPKELDLKAAFEAAMARAEARIASEEAGAAGNAPVPLRDEDWGRFSSDIIGKNERRILDMTSDGTIAVAVLDPRGLATTTLERMGWDGKAAVFPINRTRAEKIARLTEAQPDPDAGTSRWLRLRERGVTRVLAVIGFGVYLMAWGPDGQLIDATKPREG